MPYQVPPSKKSLKQNRFEFNMPGDKKVYSVPLLKFLKPDLVLELDELSQGMAMRRLLEVEMPGLLPKFDELDQLVGLFEQWGKESGIELGESSASPES